MLTERLIFREYGKIFPFFSASLSARRKRNGPIYLSIYCCTALQNRRRPSCVFKVLNTPDRLRFGFGVVGWGLWVAGFAGWALWRARRVICHAPLFRCSGRPPGVPRSLRPQRFVKACAERGRCAQTCLLFRASRSRKIRKEPAASEGAPARWMGMLERVRTGGVQVRGGQAATFSARAVLRVWYSWARSA